MKQRDFRRLEFTEPIRLSGGEFCLVVETLDGSGGNSALSLEPIQDEVLMIAQHARDSLHRFDPRAHSIAAPPVQKDTSPEGRLVGPENLELLLEQIAPDSPEIV